MKEEDRNRFKKRLKEKDKRNLEKSRSKEKHKYNLLVGSSFLVTHF
jgi:hypothetical protein